MAFLCDLQYGDVFYWNGSEYYHDTIIVGDVPSVLNVRRIGDGQSIKLRSHTEVEVR